MKIVETDNYNGDYPGEKFLNIPPLSDTDANKVAGAINSVLCRHDGCSRYWKVVDDDYILQPGFEP